MYVNISLKMLDNTSVVQNTINFSLASSSPLKGTPIKEIADAMIEISNMVCTLAMFPL